MRFVSTRGAAPAVTFSEAITNGLAPDGGLYVPERFPEHDPAAFADLDGLPEIAARFLDPFFEGDPLRPQLADICRGAFDFPMVLSGIGERTAVLELFHGPTAAFKDFGARFLAECFSRQPLPAAGVPRLILVATSGDTGGAVAAAFHEKPATRVGILFPDGGVSARQEHQLTCWGGNVTSFAVAGTFDDCQRTVKTAFADEAWRDAVRLTSANSINIGRLLPQAAYYAAASLVWNREYGSVPGVIVPSGNMGNAVGAFWARRMGLRIGHIALACNANRTVPDWFLSGDWTPRASVATLANAMDVGDPSNMERLFHMFPRREDFLEGASATSVDDATIRTVIAAGPDRWDRVWCPHTATAMHYLDHLPDGDWIVVATAHPAKFDTIVEPLIDGEVVLPPALAELLDRPTHVERIAADPAKLKEALA